MEQIAQLKYYMGFSMFEINTMTAEDREFYLKWFAKTRTKEKEAESAPSAAEQGPKLGPSA